MSNVIIKREDLCRIKVTTIISKQQSLEDDGIENPNSNFFTPHAATRKVWEGKIPLTFPSFRIGERKKI
jgi:hypothetical protein